MHKILIVEDEVPAKKKLIRFIDEICSDYQIVGEIATVKDAMSFFSSPREIDVIFSDIELRDGNIFGVYKELSVPCPIIFVTAYNKFLMEAFETNGIAYLLKPYSKDRFSKAWEKFLKLKDQSQKNYQDVINTLNELLLKRHAGFTGYKEMFPIRSARGIYFLKVAEIVYFKAEDGLVFAFDRINKKHIMSQRTLKEVIELLDPDLFFSINRGELIHRKYIERIERYDKNSLLVNLNKGMFKLKTSQQKTAAFNQWIGL